MRTIARYRVIQAICWTGVVADALWAVALAYPPLYAFLTGRPIGSPELFLRLTMGIGASLMAGWTVLLAWTAQNPIERRAVMLFTALPTLTGLAFVTLVGMVNGNPTRGWILGKCLLLTAAMLIGYHLAGTVAKEDVDENHH